VSIETNKQDWFCFMDSLSILEKAGAVYLLITKHKAYCLLEEYFTSGNLSSLTIQYVNDW